MLEAFSQAQGQCFNKANTAQAQMLQDNKGLEALQNTLNKCLPHVCHPVGEYYKK